MQQCVNQSHKKRRVKGALLNYENSRKVCSDRRWSKCSPFHYLFAQISTLECFCSRFFIHTTDICCTLAGNGSTTFDFSLVFSFSLCFFVFFHMFESLRVRDFHEFAEVGAFFIPSACFLVTFTSLQKIYPLFEHTLTVKVASDQAQYWNIWTASRHYKLESCENRWAFMRHAV